MLRRLTLAYLMLATPTRGFIVSVGAPRNSFRHLSAGARDEPSTEPIGFLKADIVREAGNPRAFEFLVDYPCDFAVKVIGERSPSFAQDIANVVGEVCNVAGNEIPFTVRDKGKWQSISLLAPVQSSGMLYKVYEVISEDSRVKFRF